MARTPRPYYDNKWAVIFKVKNNETFYDILKWNESGTNQALIKTGKYNGEDPKSLIPKEIIGDAQ